MDRCFNFLINVDQCLNMSNFDMFFYELESHHRFHLNNVRFDSDDRLLSIEGAAWDIRMYLNKYPFQVGSYRIIVLVRQSMAETLVSPSASPLDIWKNTLLYKILRIYYALQDAGIFIKSKEQMDRMLHIVMLYDQDMTVDAKDYGQYDVEQDFDCLLTYIGINKEGNTDSRLFVEALKQSLARVEKEEKTAANIIRDFLSSYEPGIDDTEKIMEYNQTIGETFGPVKSEELLPNLLHEIEAKTDGYLITRRNVDKNNREQNLIEFLRIVEYLNRDLIEQEDIIQDVSARSLYQRCLGNWNKVQEDKEIETKYAGRVKSYHERLLTMQNEMETSFFDMQGTSELPQREKPKEGVIESDSEGFSSADRSKKSEEFRGLLKAFLQKHFRISLMRQYWEQTYQEMKKDLNSMSVELESYASELSRKYAREMEKRKAHFRTLGRNRYRANTMTEGTIHEVEYERDTLMAELKSPHMTPSLRFQDQLNMENALEQANLDISFYIGCMEKITAGCFFAFAGLLLLLVFIHFYSLQSDVFSDGTKMITSLLYCLIVVLLAVLFAWGAPYRYFRRKMKKTVNNLIQETDKYIQGYFQKAEQFKLYINELNQLDECIRYLKLLTDVNEEAKIAAKKHLWNKVQIKKHLEKLDFFKGLFELALFKPKAEESVLPDHYKMDKDVIDNPLYWP